MKAKPLPLHPDSPPTTGSKTDTTE